ncbi:hypothetical protein [Streptococcus equi]
MILDRWQFQSMIDWGRQEKAIDILIFFG